ncbi:SMI1/KNR4 family protein [Allobaculum sp. Allo2]|nr:SMI1/KNR4 family protein [Allobaculum sp. Allo2]UNT93235.1 SMI1/KNR4 family protein [Allobaculum sp. Allo2]
MLLEFEDRYNLCLPGALKDFYRTCNGMSMFHTPLEVDGHTYVVDHFIPLFTGNMSADHILDLYSMGNLIPDTYFPLALSDTDDDFSSTPVRDRSFCCRWRGRPRRRKSPAISSPSLRCLNRRSAPAPAVRIRISPDASAKSGADRNLFLRSNA